MENFCTNEKAMITDCISDLPHHHILIIHHNEHKSSYQTILEYLKDCDWHLSDMENSDIEECVATNELWEIQLYPITPISFYWAGAATLKRAVELIIESTKRDGRI